MRKLFILVPVVLALASKPADAACRLGPCPPAVQAIGYTVAGALVGGYGYGMGYLIYHDVTDRDQTLNWGVTEFTVNGLGVFLFGGASVQAIANHEPKAAAA